MGFYFDINLIQIKHKRHPQKIPFKLHFKVFFQFQYVKVHRQYTLIQNKLCFYIQLNKNCMNKGD